MQGSRALMQKNGVQGSIASPEGFNSSIRATTRTNIRALDSTLRIAGLHGSRDIPFAAA